MRRNLNQLTLKTSDEELNLLAEKDLTSAQAKDDLFNALKTKLFGQDGSRSIQQSALSQQGAAWQAHQAVLTIFNNITYGFIEMNSGGIDYILEETDDDKKLISISQKTIPKEMQTPTAMLDNLKPFCIEELPNGIQPYDKQMPATENNALSPNGGSRVEVSFDKTGGITYKFSQDSAAQEKLAPLLDPIKSSLNLDNILSKVHQYNGDDPNELLDILTGGINENIRNSYKEIIQDRLSNYLISEHANTPGYLLLDSLFNENQINLRKYFIKQGFKYQRNYDAKIADINPNLAYEFIKIVSRKLDEYNPLDDDSHILSELEQLASKKPQFRPMASQMLKIILFKNLLANNIDHPRDSLPRIFRNGKDDETKILDNLPNVENGLKEVFLAEPTIKNSMNDEKIQDFIHKYKDSLIKVIFEKYPDLNDEIHKKVQSNYDALPFLEKLSLSLTLSRQTWFTENNRLLIEEFIQPNHALNIKPDIEVSNAYKFFAILANLTLVIPLIVGLIRLSQPSDSKIQKPKKIINPSSGPSNTPSPQKVLGAEPSKTFLTPVKSSPPKPDKRFNRNDNQAAPPLKQTISTSSLGEHNIPSPDLNEPTLVISTPPPTPRVNHSSADYLPLDFNLDIVQQTLKSDDFQELYKTLDHQLSLKAQKILLQFSGLSGMSLQDKAKTTETLSLELKQKTRFKSDASLIAEKWIDSISNSSENLPIIQLHSKLPDALSSAIEENKCQISQNEYGQITNLHSDLSDDENLAKTMMDSYLDNHSETTPNITASSKTMLRGVLKSLWEHKVNDFKIIDNEVSEQFKSAIECIKNRPEEAETFEAIFSEPITSRPVRSQSH